MANDLREELDGMRAQNSAGPSSGQRDTGSADPSEESLKHQLEIERTSREKVVSDLNQLRERLRAEEEENAQLSKSLKEQQGKDMTDF